MAYQLTKVNCLKITKEKNYENTEVITKRCSDKKLLTDHLATGRLKLKSADVNQLSY